MRSSLENIAATTEINTHIEDDDLEKLAECVERKKCYKSSQYILFSRFQETNQLNHTTYKMKVF